MLSTRWKVVAVTVAVLAITSQAVDFNLKLIADHEPAIVANGEWARSVVRFQLTNLRGNKLIKLTGLQLGPNYAKVGGTPTLHIQEHDPSTDETRVFAYSTLTLINQDEKKQYIFSGADVVLRENCFYRIDMVVRCKEQGSDQVWTKFQLPTDEQQIGPKWSAYKVKPCDQAIPGEIADVSALKNVAPLWDGPGSILEEILLAEERR